MKTVTKTKTDGLRASYDFSGGARGKHHQEYAQGSNVVLLTTENAKHFPTPEAVNSALAAFLRLSRPVVGKTRSAVR